MSTIVAIDLGLKRVGVAISEVLNDPSLAIPAPLEVWTYAESEAKLLQLIKQRSISIVVFGLPLNSDGTESAMSQKVRRFAKRVSKRAKIKIAFTDEFASSIEANELVFESNKGSGRNQITTDAHAAAVILSRYLSELK